MTHQRKDRPATRVMSGATGFLGSHLALRWSREEGGAHLLVRAASEHAAHSRLEDALESARAALDVPSSSRRVAGWRAVCCDLSLPGAPVSPEVLGELRRHDVTEFWHFAASLRYEDRHRAQIFATNVEGTRRALELARELGAGWFIYISTAYTAGRMSGLIPERLHGLHVGFNNYYEQSKAQCEQEVASYCQLHGLRHAILRPSIVVGPFATKRTGGSATGLYGFARELQRMSTALRERAQPLALAGDADTECNLIPVDWFLDDVTRLVRDGLQDGGIYHHTCAPGLTIREVGEVLAGVLDLPGFSIMPQRPAARSPVEALLDRRIGFYASYLGHSKRFARQRPFERRLYASDLQQFLRAFVAETASERTATERGREDRVASASARGRSRGRTR